MNNNLITIGEEEKISNPNKVEEIVIYSLKDLANINYEIAKLQNIINIHMDIYDESTKEPKAIYESNVLPLQAKIEELKLKFKDIFELLSTSVIYSPDKFLDSIKVKGDSYKEGRYKIIRHIKTTRKLNQSAFKKKYPNEFKQYAEIGLGKADNAIGKDKVNEICTINDVYTYEFNEPQLY